MLKKIIAAVLAGTAFFVIVGTVGAYDAETISGMRCILTVAVCLIVEDIAFKCLNK